MDTYGSSESTGRRTDNIKKPLDSSQEARGKAAERIYNTMNIIAQKTITSMEVAEMVEKDHRHLLTDIRRYASQLAETKIGLGDFFIEGTYKDANKQERPCYNVTEKGCEFIAHKLTGVKGTAFTAKYINRFHDMEDTINSGYVNPKTITATQNIKLLNEAIGEIDGRIESVKTDLDTFKQEQPMYPVELDEITKEVRAKVVMAVGGKNTEAYKDRALRSRVFRDIYEELHRQFGVVNYKAIKRKDMESVRDIIEKYSLPLALSSEVTMTNAQTCISGC